MELKSLRVAAKDVTRVQGLTHGFYRYPARFSPLFAKAAIETFSNRGDTILDPFMGGGTTIVEGLANGRHVIGADINSLSVFVTRIKTTPLQESEKRDVLDWSRSIESRMGYRNSEDDLTELLSDVRTVNLHLPPFRAIKKAIAIGLAAVQELPSDTAQDFARGVLLHTGQWALDNRRQSTSMGDFRQRFVEDCESMIRELESMPTSTKPILINGSSEQLPEHRAFRAGRLADLIVTSPPYPGIHVLYHRWQVDGRRESPAPYWIADCLDGEGSAYYTLGDRKESGQNRYFSRLAVTMKAIHSVLKSGGRIVQMVAFSEKSTQLSRYLATMKSAGFREMTRDSGRPIRIWRGVPNRKWHAHSKGKTSSAREVVLIHERE